MDQPPARKASPRAARWPLKDKLRAPASDVTSPSFGGVVASAQHVVVEGGWGGAFTVPSRSGGELAGLPLTVTRIRQPRALPGDFGHGWSSAWAASASKEPRAGRRVEVGVTVGTFSTPSTYQLIDARRTCSPCACPMAKCCVSRQAGREPAQPTRLAPRCRWRRRGLAWLPFQYGQPLNSIARGRAGGATLAARGAAPATVLGWQRPLLATLQSMSPELAKGRSATVAENSAQEGLAAPTPPAGTHCERAQVLFDADGRLESMRDPGSSVGHPCDGAGRIERVPFQREADHLSAMRTASSSGSSIPRAVLPVSYDDAGDLRAFYDRVTDHAAASDAAI